MPEKRYSGKSLPADRLRYNIRGTYSGTLTHSKGISRKARLNRKALCRLMRSEGFVNYPGEWWHFSYGDRMWAAYAHRKKAVYDTVVEKG
ncbi:MAG: M15 family metallopeptidase [Odoribacter sp.]